jgi:hypothetical protein
MAQAKGENLHAWFQGILARFQASQVKDNTNVTGLKSL